MCQLNNVLLCFELCFQFFDSNNFDFFCSYMYFSKLLLPSMKKKSFLVKKKQFYAIINLFQ